MKETIVISEKEDFDIQKVLSRLRSEKDKEFVLQFDFNEYDSEVVSKIEKLYNVAQSEKLINFIENPFEILLMQNRIETQTFSQGELEVLKGLCDRLGQDITFTDDYYKDGEESHYTFEMIKNTCDKIRGLVKEIKSKNLSPAEEYVYVCLKILKRPYKDYDPTLLNDEKLDALLKKFRCTYKNTHLSRSVNGVCNSEYAVCAGYSYLQMSICKELGIECFTQGVMLEFKDGKIPHRINVCHLKDEKYGIDDYEVTDITNLRQKGSDGKTYVNLNFLLFPLDDIEKISKRGVSFYENFEQNRQQFLHSPLNEIINKEGVLKTENAYGLAILKGLVLQNYKIKPKNNKMEELFESNIDDWSKMVEEEFKDFVSEMKKNSRAIDVKKILQIYDIALQAMEDSELSSTESGSIKYSVEFAKEKSDESVSIGFRNYSEEIE